MTRVVDGEEVHYLPSDMAERTFTDSAGIAWRVWDVVPTWTERRSGVDRRVLPLEQAPDPPVRDLRKGKDRRRGPDGARRIRVAESLRLGWLAFESRSERRRLGPIPHGWADLSSSELQGLCAKATSVTPTTGRLVGE